MLERVAKVAATVGVPSSLSHAPHELSGGQKQRVSLAGVMINDVKVLLFDEPLANLDPATGKKAIELIDDIHKQTGAAVIIIEHRIEDVLHRDVDRIILVNDGRIIADLHPNEILCGDALKNAGLREPLYITAMKYAGVKIVPDMLPQHIEDIVLSAETKKLVSDWFEKTPAAEQSEKGPAIFQAEHIRFSYSKGHEVIHDVSFTVHRGEIMCIIGQNGAGKSTISKLICGFERPQEGTMLLEGVDISPLSIKERAEHIGFVMQDPNQMLSKTMIREEVGLALELDGLPREEIDRKVDETLKVCGLYPFRNWPISALSFGQKKRVTVASILSMNPEIVILDEPTAGQDFKHYTEIMDFLLALNRQGVTVVMITHDMHLMLEYAPRAVVFTDGKILCDDTPANILTNPDLVEAASLKETSLFTLAVRCGISEPSQFVQRFIDYDRRVRER